MRPIVFFACALLASSASAQSPTFSGSRTPAAGAPRAIAAADFNRDGWIDFASAGTGRDSVGIHLNRGASGGFTFAHDIVVAGGPFDMTAGDLNRDAIADLVIANADLHTVTILLGNGDGSFRPKLDVPVPGNPRGVALADHDKDGILDIFVTRYAQGSWTVFYGDGEGGTRAETTLAAGTNPQGIATGDFNDDGVLDVVVANAGSGVTAYYSNGPMTWVGSTVPGSRAGNVLATADFNRDGRLDLAVASTSMNRVSVYQGTASGLQWIADRATGSSPRGILTADLNQDGLVEIVAANRGSNTLSILSNRPDAPWQFAAVTQPAGPGSRAVATGDANHDGRADLVSANEFGNDATVLLNTTSLVKAGFSFHVERPLGENDRGYGSPDILEIADFDGNGKPDVVSANIIRFDGTARSTTLPVTSLEDLVVADFNRDGDEDIATLSYWNNAIQVFFGNGAGAFAAVSPHAIVRGREFAVADLNRDGKDDLVVLRVIEARTNVLTVLHGRGDGTFAAGGDVQAPESPYHFAIADMNRDGLPDIVVGHVYPAAVSVLYGDASGTWLRSDVYALGGDLWGTVEVGDFNEDGVPDIVTSGVPQPSSGEGVMTLLLGRASGGFTATEFPGGPYGYEFTSGDIDLDGHLDLLLPASDILYGNGDGTFVMRRFHYYDEGGNQRIFDFNRDGLPDVVSGTLGWFAVMQNERNATNRNPIADAGPDHTESYAGQFGEEASELDAYRSSDPDLHEPARFEWRNAAGELLTTNAYFAPSSPGPGQYTFSVTVYDGYGGVSTDTTTWTITPYKEIVLHPGPYWMHGAWQWVEDATAAAGHRMFHPDAGAPKVTTPLATPVNYIEYSFPADPTQTYKLWIRGKAQGNSWANDSVWVQFTGATASDGRQYRIGTTSALAWNLEECSGCGISGWGWEDDGWGAVNRNGVTLRFPEGGMQKIRIQTREDGVSIDQIVLSAEQFLTTRPGKAKNDTVILWATYY